MATSARVVNGKKPKSGKAGQNRPRSRGGTYVGIAEQLRMCEQYVAGGPDNSIRKIAKRFRRDEVTVAKIVRSETMEQLAEQCKKSLVTNAAEKIVERLAYELSNKSKNNQGAYVALELADRLGIAPRTHRWGGSRIADSRAPIDVTPEKEDDRVARIVRELAEVTIERGRLFGMPMPELEELRQDIPVEVSILKKEQAE